MRGEGGNKSYGHHRMAINVDMALNLSLFIIGAVVLAIDNLVDALYKRFTNWLRQRTPSPGIAQPVPSGWKKRLQQ
jgi:hypothetical protein